MKDYRPLRYLTFGPSLQHILRPYPGIELCTGQVAQL